METIRNLDTSPDYNGYFGEYGGVFVPDPLKDILTEINDSYLSLREDPEFIKELASLHRGYIGRPSPVYFASKLTQSIDGGRIFFKREDLNHTGAHKINHCLGEALVAKKMGKK